MVELKSCPFCGGKPLLDHLGDNARYGFYVHCDDCETQQIANYTSDDAIKRWNRRHD